MTPPRPRVRMSGSQRREQLIHIGRATFAERGVAAATVEEIAAAAGVTKPVVYEHFGGKEGLYAVIVDRETRAMLDHIAGALVDDMPPRALFEKTVVALLEYISENPDGFRVMVRDAPSWHSTGSLASLMSDIATQIEHELSRVMQRREIDPRFAPLYAQMLMGMAALTGDWWLEHGHEFGADVVAAHMVNLAWNGLTGLDPNPTLATTSLASALPPARRHREAQAQAQAQDDDAPAAAAAPDATSGRAAPGHDASDHEDG